MATISSREASYPRLAPRTRARRRLALEGKESMTSKQHSGREYHFASLRPRGAVLGIPWSSAGVIGASCLLGLLSLVAFRGMAGPLGGVVAVLAGIAGAIVVRRSTPLRATLGFLVQAGTKLLCHGTHSRAKPSSVIFAALPSRARSEAPKTLICDFEAREVSGVQYLFDRKRKSPLIGFELPDSQPWLMEQSELGQVSVRWSNVLRILASGLPRELEVLWRVDIEPMAVSPETFPRWNREIYQALVERSWVSKPSLWLTQDSSTHMSSQHSKAMRILQGKEAVYEAFSRAGLPRPRAMTSQEDAIRILPWEHGALGGFDGGSLPLRRSDVAISWDEMRIGANFGLGLSLSSWPPSAVAAGFALPMLRPAPPRRVVFMRLRSVSPKRALRGAQRHRSEALANAKMRANAGFMTKTQDALGEVDLQRQEEELATGHSLYEHEFGVLLLAGSRSSLRKGVSELDLLASAAQVRLDKAYGRQLEILCSVLASPHSRGAPR